MNFLDDDPDEHVARLHAIWNSQRPMTPDEERAEAEADFEDHVADARRNGDDNH